MFYCNWIRGFSPINFWDPTSLERRYRHWITVSTVGGLRLLFVNAPGSVRFHMLLRFFYILVILYPHGSYYSVNIPWWTQYIIIYYPMKHHLSPLVPSFFQYDSITLPIHSFISNPILSSHSHSIPFDPSKSIHFSMISDSISSKPQKIGIIRQKWADVS